MSSAPPAAVPIVVRVTLSRGSGKPFANPDPCHARWRRASGGDVVRFQCPDPFTVEFPKDSPFDVRRLDGQRENGLFVAEGRIREDVPEEETRFKYDLTVDGETVDPDIVVKKDPR